MRDVPTRAEMLAALDDSNPGNPLAIAIAAAIAAYGDALADQANRAGTFPNPLVLPMPRTEREAFAVELFTEEMRAHGICITLPNTTVA